MDKQRLLELAGVQPLNEWQKDINTVSLLIDMLKKQKEKHGDFQVMVSNDGATIHIYPDKDQEK